MPHAPRTGKGTAEYYKDAYPELRAWTVVSRSITKRNQCIKEEARLMDRYQGEAWGLNGDDDNTV